ncbi:MAG: pyridoxamine 5'-phosphate oxidase family protein [Actinomycetota bacterium]|nr:pyridoxamine 5'-phosphate oxidase family protein [Actinomycetota bacterium]
MGALPEEVEKILNAALVCEFSVVDARGRPVTHPMLPLYDGELIYMTSSILFSKKLAHVRENPKVAISISDRNAVHGEPLRDRVTIQGDASLHDADVHTDWERILPLWTAKEPIVSMFYAKRVALPLFWERVVIEMRPRRALLWENGRTDVPPKVFEVAEVG